MLYGAIIGDIVGSRFEFDKEGWSKDFEFITAQCGRTDDTIMTIAVAEALMKAGKEALEEDIKEACIHSMQEWGKKYPWEGYGSNFAMWLREDDPQPYNSWGNGSAMRVSAAGWLYDSLERTREVARATAIVTHNHPEGMKGAECTASVIYMARHGATKKDIEAYVRNEFGYNFSESLEAMRQRHRHDESCQDSLPKALRSFMDGTGFADVIRNAVSLGGDADTIAAIAGSMGEAFYGVSEELKNECSQHLEPDLLEALKRFEKNAQMVSEHNDYYQSVFLTAYEVSPKGLRCVADQEIQCGTDYEFAYSLFIRGDYFGRDYYRLQASVLHSDKPRPVDPECFAGMYLLEGYQLGGKYDIPILVRSREQENCEYCLLQVRKERMIRTGVLQPLGLCEITQDNFGDFLERIDHTMRVVGFEEMMNYVETDKRLRGETAVMVKQTKVYPDCFFSTRHVAKKGKVSLQENTTLLSARSYVGEGKHTAVLNFANPVEPGGGVLRGAKAQEENLCRSSNLYKSLVSEGARTYYDNNRAIMESNQYRSIFLGTDQLIYSPNVAVLKYDYGYAPGMLRLIEERYHRVEERYYVDVITCAAPIFQSSDHMLPDGDLEYLLKRRIRNIFEAAIDNDIEVLILGAFGCGAFHNPPEVVAKAFWMVLQEERYKYAFDEVVFAIKRSKPICPNMAAFEKYFEKAHSLET